MRHGAMTVIRCQTFRTACDHAGAGTLELKSTEAALKAGRRFLRGIATDDSHLAIATVAIPRGGISGGAAAVRRQRRPGGPAGGGT